MLKYINDYNIFSVCGKKLSYEDIGCVLIGNTVVIQDTYTTFFTKYEIDEFGVIKQYLDFNNRYELCYSYTKKSNNCIYMESHPHKYFLHHKNYDFSSKTDCDNKLIQSTSTFEDMLNNHDVKKYKLIIDYCKIFIYNYYYKYLINDWKYIKNITRIFNIK